MKFNALVEQVLNEISQPFTGHDDYTKRAMASKAYGQGGSGSQGSGMSPEDKEAEQQAGSNQGHPQSSLDRFQYLLKVNGKWMGFNRNRGDRGVYPAELVAKAKELGMNSLIGNPNVVKQWR